MPSRSIFKEPLSGQGGCPSSWREGCCSREKLAVGTLNGVKFGPGGSRQISFVSESSKRQKVEQPEEGKMRGIQYLGLKPSRSGFYAMGKQGGRG